MDHFEPDTNKLTPEQRTNPLFRPVEIRGDMLTQTPDQAERMARLEEQAKKTVVITGDGFDRIVTGCVDEMMSDEKLQKAGGMSLLLMPMLGVHFAAMMKKKLFGELDT